MPLEPLAKLLVLLGYRIKFVEAPLRARMVRLDLRSQLLHSGAQRDKLVVLSRSTLRPRGGARLELHDALPRLVEFGCNARASRFGLAHLGPRAPVRLYARHLGLSIRLGRSGLFIRMDCHLS